MEHVMSNPLNSKHLQTSVSSILTSFGLFLLGATVKGEWLHILVHIFNAYNVKQYSSNVTEYNLEDPLDSSFDMKLKAYINACYMTGLTMHVIYAIMSSFVMYFTVGGYLHWYYYIKLRDRASEWKCQPNKFPSTKTQMNEILRGSSSLLLCSIISGIISCYTFNGGPSRLYYNITDHGVLWYFASWPIAFVWQDYLTYWMHRLLHTPWFYKRVHKVHHAYKQPTAFCVTAFHPVELISLQAILWSPMFLFPLHWSVFVGILMYVYYHGLLDHSGINFKAKWWQPWQPDCIFHDDHHHYTYYNFAVNIGVWDKVHGTHFQQRANKKRI